MTPAAPRPTPAQRRWQDFEIGAIFHLDLPQFSPAGWTTESRWQVWDPASFDPPALETDQWLAAAKDLGARYAIFTATHHNGFLHWPTDAYDYGVKESPWRGGKGDLVGEFVESCRRAGLAPGLYLSTMFNTRWGVKRGLVRDGAGGDPQRQAAFCRTCEQLVEELCSRYGPLCEIWFDAGVRHPGDGGPDVLPIVEKHQPETVFYHSPQRRDHRWVGNEDGVTAYPCWATLPDLAAAETQHRNAPDHRAALAHGDPDGALWCPGMCDPPLRDHEWFWRPGEDHKIMDLERLLTCHEQSVGRNCNLMVGLTPDTRGLVPEADRRRCAEFGAALRRRYGSPLAATAGAGETLTLELPAPARLDRAVLAEAIEDGERIRRYVLEARTGGEAWTELARGQSVGHKRIETFPPREAAALRLRVTESTGPVRLREFTAYESA
jgi:alpha-L-fucosidase